jgi:hypothetical protein
MAPQTQGPISNSLSSDCRKYSGITHLDPAETG